MLVNKAREHEELELKEALKNGFFKFISGANNKGANMNKEMSNYTFEIFLTRTAFWIWRHLQGIGDIKCNLPLSHC